MMCRQNCGACCIAASISSALPGMPQGKPAGVPCVNLDASTSKCAIWGTAVYPEVCRKFKASADSCGDSKTEALELLFTLEASTR